MTNKNLEHKTEKPLIIKLTPLKKTVVHVPTKKEYDELMMVYELGNWKFIDGSLPTKFCGWKYYKEETCINVKDKFARSHKNLYLENNYKMIAPQEFYDKQKITPDMLNEINKYFENKK